MPLLTALMLPRALCMKPIAIATLCLSVALLCLAHYLSPPAQELLLPDPAMSMLSSAITFNHFVCCGCYDRGPGSRSSELGACQVLLLLFLLETVMTISTKPGTVTTNEIMRTSCPHRKALWHTILDPGICWLNSCLMCRIGLIGVFWTRLLWTRRCKDCQFPCSALFHRVYRFRTQ
jgi:hypothetical protein